MFAYLIRRLGLLIPVMLGVVTLVFLLIHFIPGDPVDIMLGDYAMPGAKEELRHQLGLDQPIWIQYGHYMSSLAKGDLGQSLHSHRPVLDEILERFPATAELMLGGMVVALIMAIPLGIISALKPHSWIDNGSMFLSFLGVSIPNFWLGPLLILLFAIQLDWLPVNERGGIEHLILPAITLGTSMAAILSRMLRSSLMDVLGDDFIRTARAKGLSEWRVVGWHALRNALLPTITIVGLQVGALLSGAIITESIFDWPGVGTLLLQGIYTRNYPVVQGAILFIAFVYVIVNVLTDLAYAWADPRVRLD